VVNQYLQNWKALQCVALGRGRMILVDESALRDVVAGNSPLEGEFTP
jgi:hypothetical protein